MKKLLYFIAFIGFMVLLWSCGENDGTVFTNGEAYIIALAGLATFGTCMFLAERSAR